MNFLENAMTVEELKVNMDENCYVTANILIDLGCIINNEFEDFLDELSYKLTGTEILMNINYKIVGVFDEQTLIMEVSGDVSSIINEDEEEEEN